MTIYIGIPNAADCRQLDVFKQRIAEKLKIYYGVFTVECIQVYYYDESFLSVHIMDKSLYLEHDDDIIKTVTQIVGDYFPSNRCRINLNYSVLNPKFNPCTPANRNQTIKKSASGEKKPSDEFDYEKLSENYHSEEPRYNFDQVILSDKLRE